MTNSARLSGSQRLVEWYHLLSNGPWVTGSSLFACGQETQCYLDPACKPTSDSLNGLACNAFG